MKSTMIFTLVAGVFAVTLVCTWLGLIGTHIAVAVYLMLIASSGVASVMLAARPALRL